MTTKTITIFALIALCALSAEAKKVTGNGNVITKEVSVNEYDAVSIGSNIVGQSDSWFSLFTQMGDKSYTFYYMQKGPASLKITIDENLYQHLKVTSQNGTLSISTQNQIELVPTSLKVTGSSKGLKKIHMSGCMNFSLQSKLSSDELEIISSKGSDINLKQPVHVKNCTINTSAGGDIEFSNLECQTISCEASGGSDIHYKGSATSDTSTSGGSDIYKDN